MRKIINIIEDAQQTPVGRFDEDSSNDHGTHVHTAEPYTQEELEQWDVDDLDRMAFGYAEGDIVTVDPDDIQIIWIMDLENPVYKFQQGGMQWVNSVDFSEPVELSVNQEGRLQLEDGHHRWFASKRLGRKVTGVVQKVTGNPVLRILQLQSEGKITRPDEGE